MPSLIPGYEYDIFISYRHKDNKYDGWVTEFVANLRKELAATLKDDVSIYFDENPHDGILDGHIVDGTIANKIKCLVFIPILSQTYCDERSFAWNNEFLAFKNFASKDPYGSTIHLKNGNVTSRIIPVRIHDLDDHDKQLVETTLGISLRSIDFVYKAPGVNRPLRAVEDRPKENLNQIYYRDQINKVANLIKGIIQALPQARSQHELVPAPKPERSGVLAAKPKPLLIAAVLLILFVSAYLTFFTSERRDPNIGTRRTALAVIPFRVTGSGEEGLYFADGVMESILSGLSSFSGLKVKSRTSVEKYRGTRKSIPEIAEELNVSYIVEGSVQKGGNEIRIIVQLVDSRNDLNMWSQTFDGRIEDIFALQHKIIESIARELKMSVTPEVSKKIKGSSTDNFEAYDLYLRAKQSGKKYADSQDPDDLARAIYLLEQSLQKDNGFALSYAWLAAFKTMKYENHSTENALRDSILLLANTALEMDSSLVEANIVMSTLYSRENNDVYALRYTYQALAHPQLDSATAMNLLKRLASVYSRVGYTERASALFDVLLQYDPDNLEVLYQKFYALAAGHRVNHLLELADRIRRISPDDAYLSLIVTHVWIEQENYAQLVNFYPRIKAQFYDRIHLLEQYTLIYAWALRESGLRVEAKAMEEKFESVFGDDNYYKALLAAYRNDRKGALAYLKDEEVGWYNLNLLEVNPLFISGNNDRPFQDFIERNRENLLNKKERIRQLEDQGFLQPSSDIIIQASLE